MYLLTIKVKVLGGATIESTFKEAIKLATKLGCKIEFNFNGVLCMAYPNGDYLKGIENYYYEIKKENGFVKIAFS